MNPQLGSWFPVNDKEGIVCNTGKPFRFQGTVNPLHVVIVEGELVIDCVLEDIFALSQLIFSAPERCGRLPATIRLADDFLEPIASKVEIDEAMYDDTEDKFEDDFEV
jgi:argonaute-like protein implicated in RNA metabolism and viral defense